MTLSAFEHAAVVGEQSGLDCPHLTSWMGSHSADRRIQMADQSGVKILTALFSTYLHSTPTMKP
jgi:hypothetical protein